MTDQLSQEEQAYADFLAADKTEAKPSADAPAKTDAEPAKVEGAPAAEASNAESQPAADPNSPEAKQAEELFPGYSKLPEEQRAAIDKAIAAERDRAAKAEQEALRFRNQVGPINRKLTHAERELERLRAQAPSKPQTAPAAPPASKAEMNSRLQKLRSELPEEAAAIEELVAANLDPVMQENKELRSQLTAVVHELEKRSAYEKMARFDPEFESKIESDDFREWVDVVSDPQSPAYNPLFAQGIQRIKAGYDVETMQTLLAQFDKDMAELYAKPSEAPKVNKPTPDFQPRRTTAAPAKPTYGSPEEQAYAEWLATQS